MTILTFPTLRGGQGPGEPFSWRKLSNTQVFDSPLTRSVQTLALPGARWACTAIWQNLPPEDSARARAFLYSLRGRAGRFTLHNFARPGPRGTAAGTPLVSGSAQTGATLITDGWAVGATLLAGDFVGIGSGAAAELRVVIADATANGSGVMSITFDEPLRASPADNAAIVTRAPTCVMRLTGDDIESSFKRSVLGPLETFTLDCVETWS